MNQIKTQGQPASLKESTLHDECIDFIEDEENDFVPFCLHVEDGALAALGERINEEFEDAYMNGYNWDILISAYVQNRDPALD